MGSHARTPEVSVECGAGFFTLIAAIAGRAERPVARAPLPDFAAVRAVAWGQGDAAREGAGELSILLEAVRLRHEDPQGGLIAVGDRRGLFSTGAEEALRRAVLKGLLGGQTGGRRVGAASTARPLS